MNATAKFPLGQIVATPGAIEAMEESGQTPAFFLRRHASGDWGEVCPEDGELNNQALLTAAACFLPIAR